MLDRNINALLAREGQAREALSAQDRVASAFTRFAGSMTFVYVHIAIVGFWALANIGLLPFVPVFDPSFVILAMVASVEAIFISTFVLISQNRMMQIDSERAALNLQISLLAEHETTRLLGLVATIAERLDVKTELRPEELEEIEELKQTISPDTVLDEIERQQGTD